MKVGCALVQMQFGTDREENVANGVDAIRRAAGDGAEIVCLPELATNIYFCASVDPAHLELAEPIPGPSTEAICAAARDSGVYVIFPLYELDTEDRQLYNTAAFINREGEVDGKYRKNSIPLVTTPKMDGIEKFYFRPGNLGYPVFETDMGIKIGITICYERHFPEGPRSLSLGGADVIFVPTATANGRSIWELELQGHAIANQLWVAGVNRVGRDRGGSDIDFYGASCFVSPEGEVVARAGEDGEEVLHYTIDTEVSDRLRSEWGFFRDRRPEIYGAITAP
jgi:N-carbamoylputrescine amidase